MADIPSHIAGSSLQAGYQANQAARAAEADRAGQANVVNRQARAADEAAETVDTADSDTAVFTDAEGAGSQGRPFEETAENNEVAGPAGAAPGDDEAAGLVRDDEGRLHVDLEA